MPAAKRIQWSQLRVGLLATAAMAIAAVLIFLLTSSTGLFQSFFTVRTYLDDSAGMAEGSPVRLNGILAGTIEKVTLSGSKDPRRVVEIVMSIKEQYQSQIPEDSKAGISASNLLGDKYINITKGQSPRPVARNGEIASQQVQDIPELMSQAATILTSFQNILGRVDGLLGEVEQGRGNIGKLIKDDELYNRVNATAAEVQSLVHDVRHSNGTISKLIYNDELYQDLRRPIQRFDALMAQLEQGNGTAGKLLKDPALYDEARASLVQAHKLLDDLNAGKGTAGKLLKDEELHQQIHLALGKINVLMDKVNSGQGTVGQLLTNPQLYTTLNGATAELHALIKDVRANPKKFLRIKLALF